MGDPRIFEDITEAEKYFGPEIVECCEYCQMWSASEADHPDGAIHAVAENKQGVARCCVGCETSIELEYE